MSYQYQNLISAQGKNFELLKAFLQSFADAGGEDYNLREYIENKELQQQIARKIIGGPWTFVGERKPVEVDWNMPFEDFLNSATNVSYEACIIKSEVDKPSVSVFRAKYPHFLPRNPISTLLYELIPIPKSMSYICLQDWIARHLHLLAVDRELIAYANRYVSFPCKIIAFGSETLSGNFSSFTLGSDTRKSCPKGICGISGFDSESGDHSAYENLVFALVRA